MYIYYERYNFLKILLIVSLILKLKIEYYIFCNMFCLNKQRVYFIQISATTRT